MKKELDSYLVEKYPKIFINRYGDMKKTAMCWGFEHNDGWFWLLDQLCESIQEYIDTNNKYREKDKQISQVVATQVKEKYGTLNFYFTGGDDYINGMIRMSENMSSNICEFCGSTEEIGTTQGWVYTICKNCYTNADSRITNLNWKEHKNIPIELSKELRKIKLDKLNKEE